MDMGGHQNGQHHNEWTWSDSGLSLRRTRIKVEPHVLLEDNAMVLAKMSVQRPLQDSIDLNE